MMGFLCSQSPNSIFLTPTQGLEKVRGFSRDKSEKSGVGGGKGEESDFVGKTQSYTAQEQVRGLTHPITPWLCGHRTQLAGGEAMCAMTP